VPRPRTEALAEVAVQQIEPGARVLDLGCGCGALAAALRHSRPDLEVHASDLEDRALGYARRNGELYGFDVHKSDWLDNVPGRFDWIITYLPHVPRAELEHLDRDCLEAEGEFTVLGGEDGLDPLRAILPHLGAHGGLLTLLAVEQMETARRLTGRCEVLAADEHDLIVLIQ
jgi:release factor glutamine methyltransferase